MFVWPLHDHTGTKSAMHKCNYGHFHFDPILSHDHMMFFWRHKSLCEYNKKKLQQTVVNWCVTNLKIHFQFLVCLHNTSLKKENVPWQHEIWTFKNIFYQSIFVLLKEFYFATKCPFWKNPATPLLLEKGEWVFRRSSNVVIYEETARFWK